MIPTRLSRTTICSTRTLISSFSTSPLSPSPTASLSNTKPNKDDQDLVQILQKNPELSLQDAHNELRWLRQSSLVENNHPELFNLVERRGNGEPLQYILGSTDFGPIDLLVKPPTLIPRPETAFVFEKFANHIQFTSNLKTSSPSSSFSSSRQFGLLDLCTGSGAIPILLTHLLPNLKFAHGIDISKSALCLAQSNIHHLGANLVTVSQANLLSLDFTSSINQLGLGDIHILTANPPYIPRSEWENLPTSVKEWEDEKALVGDQEDGLGFYRRIAQVYQEFEKVELVGVEIGVGQGEAVQNILRSVGLRTEIWFDQFENQRFVLGERV